MYRLRRCRKTALRYINKCLVSEWRSLQRHREKQAPAVPVDEQRQLQRPSSHHSVDFVDGLDMLQIDRQKHIAREQTGLCAGTAHLIHPDPARHTEQAALLVRQRAQLPAQALRVRDENAHGAA